MTEDSSTSEPGRSTRAETDVDSSLATDEEPKLTTDGGTEPEEDGTSDVGEDGTTSFGEDRTTTIGEDRTTTIGEDGVFHRIEVGDTSVTDARTVTEADLANFAGVSGDFNHIHTDEERMQASVFGERIAHGMFVLSAATGLIWQYRSIEVRDAVVAFYGLDDLRFRKPVYIGDTIHVEREVLEKTPRPDGPGNGTVRFALEIKNQREETVISCEMTSLLE